MSVGCVCVVHFPPVVLPFWTWEWSTMPAIQSPAASVSTQLRCVWVFLISDPVWWWRWTGVGEKAVSIGWGIVDGGVGGS